MSVTWAELYSGRQGMGSRQTGSDLSQPIVGNRPCWRQIASLTVSDCVKSFLSVLARALERERHFALIEEVPCRPRLARNRVPVRILDPTHASLRSIPGS